MKFMQMKQLLLFLLFPLFGYTQTNLVPNSGFEYIGWNQSTENYHPLAWSSNQQQAIAATGQPTLYLDTIAPYAGAVSVVLKQAEKNGNPFNPIFTFGFTDYIDTNAYFHPYGLVYVPKGKFVQCVSGMYKLKKFPGSAVEAYARMYSVIQNLEAFTGEVELTETHGAWQSFEVCALTGEGFGFYPDNSFALDFLVTGNEYDSDFELKLDNVEESLVIGMQEKELVSKVSIYPNPVTNILHITGGEEKMHWQVFAVSGKPILNGVGNRAEVEKLEAGVYFLKVDSKTGQVVYPFVKQ